MKITTKSISTCPCCHCVIPTYAREQMHFVHRDGEKIGIIEKIPDVCGGRVGPSFYIYTSDRRDYYSVRDSRLRDLVNQIRQIEEEKQKK